MGLTQQLEAFKEQFARTAPAGRAALYDAKIEELRATFALDAVIGVGAVAPSFELPDARGGSVSLSDLLAQGPVVVTFYRGGWCPYCNIQLKAYQAILPDLATLGAQLVAISPQLPEHSEATAQADALTFAVLSDVGNGVARRFGLVFTLPEELREAMRSNNKALPGFNGDESWDLPVPATFVIGRDGRVVLSHVDVDYRHRLAPEAIVQALRMS